MSQHVSLGWPDAPVNTFEIDRTDYREAYGLYRVARWADTQLLAVIPRAHHPPLGATGVPFPPNTIEREVSPFEVEGFHPAEYNLLVSLYPLVFRFELGPYWDARLLVSAWATRLRAHYERAHALKGGRRGRHADEYRQWAALTRALAADSIAGFGADYRAAMLTAAGAVEQTLSWAQAYVKNPPEDARGLADFYLSVDLWAIDWFVETVNVFTESSASIPWTAGPVLKAQVLRRSELVRTMLEPWPFTDTDDEELDLSAGAADAWKMRIKRFDERILLGQRDALMADVLRSLQG